VNGTIRVAVGCVAPVPIVVEAADPDAVQAAVRAAGIDPPGDVHASSEYRAHLAEVLAVRAARQALGRN
jgi:carbon-monoxide dehydrogenase medium subunit